MIPTQNNTLFIRIEQLISGPINKKAMSCTGLDAEKHLLRCLLKESESKEFELSSSSKEKTKMNFIKNFLLSLSSQRKFIDYFGKVITEIWDGNIIANKVKALFESMEVPQTNRLIMSLSIAMSNIPKIAQDGAKLLQREISEISNPSKVIEVPDFVIASLCQYCQHSTELDDYNQEIENLLKGYMKNLDGDEIMVVNEFSGNDPRKNGDLQVFMKKTAPLIDAVNSYMPSQISQQTISQNPSINGDIFSLRNIMKELGPSCTTTNDNIMQLLEDFQRLTEDDLMDAIIMIANNLEVEDEKQLAQKTFRMLKGKESHDNDKYNGKWNVDNFLTCCSKKYPHLQWGKGIKRLDSPNVNFTKAESLNNFFTILKKVKKIDPENFQFPTSIFYQKWKNTRQQAKFLYYIFQSNMVHALTLCDNPKRVFDLSIYDIDKSDEQALKVWSYLDLVEILLDISDSDLCIEIEELFISTLTSYPLIIKDIIIESKARSGTTLLAKVFAQLFQDSFSLPTLKNALNSSTNNNNTNNNNTNLSANQQNQSSRHQQQSDNSQQQQKQHQQQQQQQQQQHHQYASLPLESANQLIFEIWNFNQELVIRALMLVLNQTGLQGFQKLILHLNEVEGIETIIWSIDYFLGYLPGLILFCNEKVMVQTWVNIQADKNKILFISSILNIILTNYGSDDDSNTEINQNKSSSSGNIVASSSSSSHYQNNNNNTNNNRFRGGGGREIDIQKETENLKESQIIEIKYQHLYDLLAVFEEKVEIMSENERDSQDYIRKKIQMIYENILDLHQDEEKDAESLIRAHFYQVFTKKEPVSSLIETISMYKNSNDNKERKTYMTFVMSVLDESRFFGSYELEGLQIMGEIYGQSLVEEIFHGEVHKMTLNYIVDCLKSYDDNVRLFGIQAISIYLENKFDLDLVNNILEVNILVEKNPEFVNKIINAIEADSEKSPESEQLKNLLDKCNTLISKDLEKYRNNSSSPNNLETSSSTQVGSNNITSSISSASGTSSISNNNSPSQGFQQNNSQNTTTGFSSSAANNNSNNNVEDKNKNTSIAAILENVYEDYNKIANINQTLKDQIIFCINNITGTTYKQKARDLKKLLLKAEAMPWLSKYLVYKRVTREINFQKLYIQLLTALEKNEVFTYILKDTYSLLYRVLDLEFKENTDQLSVDKEKNKGFLKSIGSWLGSITLARNKPIILKDLDLKLLILEGYEKKKLDVIVPLVCKVLSSANQSNIFRPQNAWVNTMLQILLEIYEMAEIKMALKCEIEVLFQQIGIAKREIVPSKFLQKRSQKSKMSDYDRITQEFCVRSIDWVATQLRNHISHDRVAGVDVKELICSAQVNAMRVILPQMVQKIVSIVMIPTRGLVLKDFALEPDDEKFLKGAKLMIQSIALNLSSLVTKDPFKDQFSQALTLSLSQEERIDAKTSEAIVENAIQQFTPLGIHFLQSIIVEKALSDLQRDHDIASALEKRKIAKEKGSFYVDQEAVALSHCLPLDLRANKEGLTLEQFKVYEDFELSPVNFQQ